MNDFDVVIVENWYAIYTLDEYKEERFLCGSVDKDEAISLLPSKYKDSVVVWTRRIPALYGIKNFWKGVVA